MTDHEAKVPSVSEILGRVLQTIEPQLQPLFLAGLERLAARRYRDWASHQSDAAIKEELLACADREEEIAKRVESLNPNAVEIQKALVWDNTEVIELNRSLFEGLSIKEQFAIQASGERAGAAVWRMYASAATDPSAQELLLSCSPLEEANAGFLESLL